MLEGGVHAVAEIARRVDQSSVQIENQQFERLYGDGSKHPDHDFSVTGRINPVDAAPGSAMMNGEPSVRFGKEFQLKHLVQFLAFVGIGLGPICLNAQAAPATQVRAPSHVSELAPGERIRNLDKFKDELKLYHDCTCKCGCYTKDLDLQADRAIAFLRKRTALHGDDKKLALVLDIDETTLSNYEQMLNTGFAYDSKAFNAWVESAKAPAIPGTLRLFKEAQRLEVNVIFLTGRPESQREVTERNLQEQGFDKWMRLILRAPEQKSSSALDYKSAARGDIEAEGYRIILSVGDQWSDLKGKHRAEYSVKYPDPYYFLK
jgi:acid phosphatase